MNKHLRVQLVWFAALWGLLLSCISVSWLAHAQYDYGYAHLYDLYAIGEHIDYYAPQNQNILGLNKVSKDVHIALFSQISTAVHNHGAGLEDIAFTVQGKTKKLLHKAEIIHLQDVANLIDKVQIASLITWVLTVILFIYLFRRKVKPKLKVQSFSLLLLLALIVATVFAVGPTKVFYQLHIWMFPDGHQWFFYYQESLMSTLMKAPDVFGGIAVSIVSIALLLFMLVLLLFSYGYRRLGFT